MLIIPCFLDEIEEYGLNSTRRMGRVCDLDWCNGLENILGKFNWKGLKDKMMKKKKEISILRSSAAEYLTFITATGESDVNAIYFDENVWLSQKTMGLLYNVETHTINYHLKKIFADCELDEASVIRKFRITASDGKGYNTNSAKIAEQHALSEFEKYRIRQDRLYQSDFDRMLLEGEEECSEK